MNFVEQLSAMALFIDFLLGATLGVVGSASLASRREDCNYSLLRTAPDFLCAGARAIHGVYTRGNGFVSDAPRGTTQADDRSYGGNDDSGPHGKESRP